MQLNPNLTWATKFRKRQNIARDDVELEINCAGQTTRRITVKEASVLSYNETYDADDGLGRFELVVQRYYCGEQEYFYIPVKQKEKSLKHIVYRLDTICLESLKELTLHWSDSSKKTDFGRPISPNNPFFTDESRAAPLNLSFSLITWDRETIYGQLELDLTAYSGRELLGHTRAAIQDRIGQLIADGYEAKYATAKGEQSTRTVGGNTVKFHLTKWYRVSTGEKRMKLTAPRIKLAYNNVNPKETKGSGIPGLLEFVGGAAAAATAQHEAAPAAEAVVSETKPSANKLVRSGSVGKGAGEITKGTPKAQNPLPNLNNAKIDSRKLTEYALNPEHPVGGNKAKVFESALGYNKSNADSLIRQVYNKLPQSEAIMGKLDQYGQRYTVDVSITGVNGNTAIVRTGWIFKPGSITPELTTLYVK